MRWTIFAWIAVFFTTVVVEGAEPPPKLSAADREFFEAKIRPLLTTRCLECHSASKKISGGLALDSRTGWTKGGDGGPVLVPGKPDESRLIEAIGWTDEDFRMPPKQKLSDQEIQLLTDWIKRGAPDPRESSVVVGPPSSDWDQLYRARLDWWSLQPIANPQPPSPQSRPGWVQNEIDAFILAKLESQGLTPAPEADRRVLARRIAFALTGLPPQLEESHQLEQDPSPHALETYVDRLLASPHFGEHWARHWMDLVHYADSHGYEWDIPAKNAWIYRDYLTRTFNRDVPYRQFVSEQIAGDLLDGPRIDSQTGLNESLIGPMSLRLGERRHGDNGEFEGITQEAMENVIDTVSKTYLATTVACAHCHDHKYDPIPQQDYYAWLGVFMSSRWVTRTLNEKDPNSEAIEKLKSLKTQMRPALAEVWLKDLDQFEIALKTDKLQDSWKKAIEDPKLALENPWRPWAKLRATAQSRGDLNATWLQLKKEYLDNRSARIPLNRKNVHVLADLQNGQLPPGWTIDGLGARSGWAKEGDWIVPETGPKIIERFTFAGLHTNLYSPRLQGALRSPLLTMNETSVWSNALGGDFAIARAIVDRAFFPEAPAYLDRLFPKLDNLYSHWGQINSRMSEEHKHRRIYLEWTTKGLNNNFPTRMGLAGSAADAIANPNSWFAVSRVVAKTPDMDEMNRFQKLFESSNIKMTSLDEAAQHYVAWLRTAVKRWSEAKSEQDDSTLLNAILQADVLTTDIKDIPKLAEMFAAYRAIQTQLKPDSTVGSISEEPEGRDERLGIRGSYFDLGSPVPRGDLRFFKEKLGSSRSGRRQLAESLTDPNNPLTARVYVNRVWHWLFGSGLVRTVDDFGHLGEQPSHPELLDYLARRFINEGWSTKKLVRQILLSATWRQSGQISANAVAKDPENRLRHHYPLQRLEAESVRDAILHASGRLDRTLYGPPIDPYRRSEDKEKRLFSGPIDGLGRRSIYTKMTVMEPPKFLTEFNQPLPKLTVGARDSANVPSQALALLNDPFVQDQAKHWARQVMRDGSKTVEQRVESMIGRALGRRPSSDEKQRIQTFANRIAQARGLRSDQLLDTVAEPVWQDLAHAIFNMKEFIHVR